MPIQSTHTQYREKSSIIQQRIAEGRGLTKNQARATVALVEELLAKETMLDKEMEGWKTAFEVEQEMYGRLVNEWNALTNWLSARFQLKVRGEPEYVSGREKKDIWTCEYPGGKVTGYATIAEAFQAGMEKVMEEK